MCNLDDFGLHFVPLWSQPLLAGEPRYRQREVTLILSEG